MTRVPRLTLGCAALVVVAMACAAAGAPTWLSTPLATLAVVAVLALLVRRRRRGPLDALLVAVAVPLVAVPLLGLLLNLLPGGLSRLSWGLGVGVLLVAGLAWDAVQPQAAPVPAAVRPPTLGGRPGRLDRHTVLRAAPWYAGAAALLALSLVLATQAAHRSERPPLSLAVVRGSQPAAVMQDGRATAATATSTGAAGNSADILVSAGTQSGDFVLVTDDGSTTRTVGPFRLSRYTTTRRTVRFTAGHRTTVTLQRASSSDAIRTLILN